MSADKLNELADIVRHVLNSGEAVTLTSEQTGALHEQIMAGLRPEIERLRAAAQDAKRLTKAAQAVLAERERQMAVHGWMPDHDDEHDAGELAAAAAAYAGHAADHLHPLSQGDGGDDPPGIWPWDREWWKPSTPRRDLEKAAALILAEMERLDRIDAALAGGQKDAD